MRDYEPIACHIHDYIEIACLYGYVVEARLANDSRVKGKALTTRTIEGREYLLLVTEKDETRIDLQHIRQLRALSTNPHFDSIDF